MNTIKKTISLLLPAFILMFTSGCASYIKYMAHPDEDWRYYGVRWDAAAIGHVAGRCFSDCHPVSEHALYGMLGLVDLPFSFVYDTLVFPFEQYGVWERKQEQALWKHKYAKWSAAIANGTFEPADVKKSLGSIEPHRLATILRQHREDDIPPELLQALLELSDLLATEISAHKQLTEPLVKSLYNHACNDEGFGSKILSNLVRNPRTPDSYVWRIMEDTARPHIFVGLAKSGRFTPEVLTNAWPDITNAPPAARYLLANHPDTPVDLLDTFYDTQKRPAHLALASNTNAPLALLQKLAASEDAYVRAAVIGNPAFPAELFSLFDTDTNWHVVRAFVENPRTPPDVLFRAIPHCTASGIKDIVEHPNVTDDLLNYIAKSKSIDYTVRDAARAKLKKRQTPRR